MSELFRRQLVDYVEYHRDPWNCAMHVVGILSLFLAAVLPLSAWHLHPFGVDVRLSAVMALPVLIYWLLLDTALGAAILGAAFLLLSLAAFIVDHGSVTVLWSLFTALAIFGVAAQIIGHRVFERRQPALVDNPSHLLLGPMFVMAKLFIVLGFRHDLAVILAPSRTGYSLSADQLQSD
jgi:uncharacterized membrane protein YGL010W